MPFSQRFKTTIKAISKLEPDIKETYKVRRNLENLAARLSLPSLDYTTWDREVKNGDYNVLVRIFEPADEANDSYLLFFHGGGWVTGNIDTYTKACANMAMMTKSVVISVDYRLAPEHKFPTGLEDCYAVAREIYLNNYADANKITLIGDSAGGNIAAALSLMAKDRGEFLPKRQILIYPSTSNNHTKTSPFQSIRENGEDYMPTAKRIADFTEMYMSSAEDINSPYFAPLLAKDLSGQPDTLILTAEYDPLRDEGEYYGKKLKQAGNKVSIKRIDDSFHGFITLSPKLPPVKEAYDAINRFLYS